MKKLVCIGGGEIPRYKNGILLPYETKEIDEEIVRLSNKKNPKLLFISIASSHPDEYFEGIKKVYEQLGCTVSHLEINRTYNELKEDILSADIIYVGGGNTKYLMDQLTLRRIDKLLVEAYNKGIVCSGLSAGSYCWFYSNYDSIKGMNVINAINIVHYNQKDDDARNKLYCLVKETNLIGYAIDNQVALEFINNDIKVIKSNDQQSAYKISFNDGKIIEEMI